MGRRTPGHMPTNLDTHSRQRVGNIAETICPNHHCIHHLHLEYSSGLAMAHLWLQMIMILIFVVNECFACACACSILNNQCVKGRPSSTPISMTSFYEGIHAICPNGTPEIKKPPGWGLLHSTPGIYFPGSILWNTPSRLISKCLSAARTWITTSTTSNVAVTPWMPWRKE